MQSFIHDSDKIFCNATTPSFINTFYFLFIAHLRFSFQFSVHRLLYIKVGSLYEHSNYAFNATGSGFKDAGWRGLRLR